MNKNCRDWMHQRWLARGIFNIEYEEVFLDFTFSCTEVVINLQIFCP